MSDERGKCRLFDIQQVAGFGGRERKRAIKTEDEKKRKNLKEKRQK